MASVLEAPVLRAIEKLGGLDAAQFFEVGVGRIEAWSSGREKIPLEAVEKVFTDPRYNPPPKIEEANWDGKKVALLMPFYRTVQPQTVFAISNILDRAKMEVFMHWGDAFIIHTRNALATEYVLSGIPASYWLDDDMIVPFGNAAKFNRMTGFKFPDKFAGMHAINRLMSHGKSMVGGLYFTRMKNCRPLFGGAFTDFQKTTYAHAAPHDTIEAVPWVATGSLYVAREVYVDIQKTFPELAPQITGTEKKDYWHFFSNSETDLTRGVNEALAVLDDAAASEAAKVGKVKELLTSARARSFTESRLKQGEDVTFCRRAAAAGHQPYVDFGCVCGHIGNKVYGPSGRFA